MNKCKKKVKIKLNNYTRYTSMNSDTKNIERIYYVCNEIICNKIKNKTVHICIYILNINCITVYIFV